MAVEPKPKGRPPKPDPGVPVKFRMQTEQANFLLAVGKRFGWGRDINEVVRTILAAEVVSLQKSGFYDKPPPGEDA